MNNTPPVVVWGTGPNSSKSHVCVALLRVLARRGIPVAPFKAITVLEPRRWREKGGAQCPIPHHVAAARIRWERAMSPVVVELAEAPGPAHGLLRIDGEPRDPVPLLTPDTLDGADLCAGDRDEIAGAVATAVARLSDKDVTLVVEGAGSPVDARDDLANLPVARALPDARIVMSAYCWNGGSTAATLGTLACLPSDVRERVIGFVQNRPMNIAAARHWAAEVQARSGVPLLAQVGDLSAVDTADLLDTSEQMADPWADAFAEHADLSWLSRTSSEVTR